MADDFKKGDKVTWSGGGTKAKGEVVKKITGETDIKGHAAKASKDDPQYIVKSSSSGAEAAHKPGSINKQ